jgi:hypothetical protein
MMAEYEQSDPTKPPKDPYGEANKPRPEEAQLGDWVEQIDAANLVPLFIQSEEGRDWLSKTVARQVCDDFKRGWDSSEEYRERRRKNNQMFTGFLPKKTFPFDNCANAHVPMMLERILRLSANVYAEIFIDRDTIFGVKPTGPDDYETSEILTLHGNWQLRNELTDFLCQQEIAVQEYFSAGSVFCHSWYDPIQRRNRHDILNCEEFVIPYVWSTVMVDLSDVPWKVRIVRKYKNELQTLRDQGEWEQVDEVLSKAPPPWDSLETKNRDQAARQEGFVAPENDPGSPYVFYEYHGWLRMPGEKRERPVCAVVESQNKVVVQLYIREEEDWRDRARFEAQTAELKRFQEDTEHHEAVMMQQQQLQMRLTMPDIDPTERQMLEEAMAQDQVQAPVPPVWMKEGSEGPEPIRRVPVENFSHGRCIYNPSGSLGLSFGTVLAELNRLADESLNRLYDSATLANIWSIIVPENLDLGSSTVAMSPGRIFKAKGVNLDKLKDQIIELRAGQANPQLMDIVRFAGDNADSAVAAPGVLSGEPGKSGETFRGIATRREMATKQLSAAGIRYLAFLDRILVNNARLNSLFMPDEEIVQVGNHFPDARKATKTPDGGLQPEITVGRDMYRRNYSVTFTADVRFTSQAQRISEADEVLGMAGQIPYLQNNTAFVYAAVVEALRARGKQDMIQALGPPPPPPTMPMGMQPPPGPPPGMAPPGPPGGPPPGGAPPPEAGAPAGVPLPAGVTGGIQGPRPEADQVQQ